MTVVLQGLGVLLLVKVGVAKLAINGTEYLQVLRSHLDGRFEERDASSVVARLAQSLALQGQV